MAPKSDSRNRKEKIASPVDNSIERSMEDFVADMNKFVLGELSVDKLLENNPTDKCDREMARTLRECGKKTLLN